MNETTPTPVDGKLERLQEARTEAYGTVYGVFNEAGNLISLPNGQASDDVWVLLRADDEYISELEATVTALRQQVSDSREALRALVDWTGSGMYYAPLGLEAMVEAALEAPATADTSTQDAEEAAG